VIWGWGRRSRRVKEEKGGFRKITYRESVKGHDNIIEEEREVFENRNVPGGKGKSLTLGNTDGP